MNLIHQKLHLLFLIHHEKLSTRLSLETLEIWASEGLDICKLSPRSWEVSIDYFNSSIDVQRHLPSAQFISWSKIGTKLTKLSIDVAKSYFLSSPKSMLRIRPRHIDDWANISSKLYKGTWKSAKLSSKFFESTPLLWNISVLKNGLNMQNF